MTAPSIARLRGHFILCALDNVLCPRLSVAERERETRQRLKLREKGGDGFYAFGGWALHSLLSSSSRVGQLYCSTSRALLALPLPYFSLWNGDQDDQKIFQLSMIFCRCKVWFYPLPLSLQMSTLPCLYFQGDLMGCRTENGEKLSNT